MPTTASVACNRTLATVIGRSSDQSTHCAAGEHESSPREHRKNRELASRSDVPLTPQRQRVYEGCFPDDRRRHRHRDCDRGIGDDACGGRARDTPDDARRHDRRAHDVQDVDAKQRHRMAARRDDESLQAEQESEDEDLEAAAADRFDRFTPAAGSLRVARRGEDDGEAREPEEQGRCEAAEHRGVAERHGASHGQLRPGVGGVRPDHQDHRNAAGPVDVGLSMHVFRTRW